MTSYRRKVAEVIDGDTFRMRVRVHGCNKVRFADVDTPPIATRDGRAAAGALKGAIGGKTVTIKPVGRSYDRLVAYVISDRKNVNKMMQRKGF